MTRKRLKVMLPSTLKIPFRYNPTLELAGDVVEAITVEEIFVDAMSVEKMFVEPMSVDEISVEKVVRPLVGLY